MTALSDRLAKANTAKLSLRAIANRAKAAGFTLSHGTVATAMNGTHGTPDDDTLYAFEAALGVPFHELRKLVGLPIDAEPYTPPAASARLTRAQRDLIDSLIHQLVRPTVEATRPNLSVVDDTLDEAALETDPAIDQPPGETEE